MPLSDIILLSGTERQGASPRPPQVRAESRRKEDVRNWHQPQLRTAYRKLTVHGGCTTLASPKPLTLAQVAPENRTIPLFLLRQNTGRFSEYRSVSPWERYRLGRADSVAERAPNV